MESRGDEGKLTKLNSSELAPNDPARQILGKVLKDIQTGGFSVGEGGIKDSVVVIGTTLDNSFKCLARIMIRGDEKTYYRLKVIDYLSRANGLYRSVVIVSDQRVPREYFDFTQETNPNYEKSARSQLPENDKGEFVQQILEAPINKELTQEEQEAIVKK